MTYVKEMSGIQLRQHMARITAMPGWNDPLAERLWDEIHILEKEIERVEDLNLKLSSACEIAAETHSEMKPGL